MTDMAVEAKHASKNYGATKALNDLTFEVPFGSIFGLLGPNGAGKTTLTRLLTGSSAPTSGSVRVAGRDPFSEPGAVRGMIGFMPQAPALYEDLTCRQNLEFFSAARALEDPRRRIDEVLALVGLAERARSPVFALSGGMKQRLSLGCALLHHPRVLLLDEPTAGVDLQLREQFWNHFRDLAAKGVAIVVSTHQMDEAVLCDKLAVLRAGELIACETPERLLQRGGGEIFIRRGSQVEERTVANIERDLPQLLRAYGLRDDVAGIEVRPESLDQVLLRIIAQGGGNAR